MSSPLVRATTSSHHQFQQSLEHYVFFSPLTMGGSSGRAVKIHKDLFLPFFCIVDPNTYDGQSIIRQIENLRTTCTIVRQETGSGYANNPRQKPEHLNRLKKINDTFHQVLIIKNLHVHYRVSQEQGDKAPGVYISSIRQISADTGGAPGLYTTNSYDEPKKISASEADGRKIYLGGPGQKIDAAILHARRETSDRKTAAFYVPSRVKDELGILGTKTKSSLTTQAINELADVFNKNVKLSKGISWYAEGEGVNLLAEAVKQVNVDLSKHEFRFLNPIANTARLIQSLSDKKARFEGEFFKYHQSKTALTLLSMQKDQLIEAIGKLPAGKNYDIITRNYILKSINELSKVGSKISSQKSELNKSAKTFTQLLKVAGVYRK